ncbi:MAG: 3-hydroxyacyl-CoA dehydrogenase NAD-binding domain-containing protein, partial [Chloroflexota bacterium]
MAIKKVGVLGMTGTMGQGIVQVCAQSGYQVVASSRSQERLAQGIAGIDKVLSRSVEKGRLSAEDKAATLGRIKGTTDTRAFSDCDLVIEVAVEDLGLKKQIFAELGQICPPAAILASNTSVLPVVEMAVASGRPEKVVGLHFFNPPPLMKLVEVIKSIVASEET